MSETKPWSSEAELAEAILPTLKDQLWEASENPAWLAANAAVEIARIALSRPMAGGVSAEDVRLVVVYHEWAIGPAPLEEQPYAQKDVNTAARRILAALDGAK